MKSFRIYIALIACAGFFQACGEAEPMDQYNSLVKTELASGKRVDSIFFGTYFGMTNKDFYAYCWEMNKKGVFWDGTNNSFVLYKLDSGLKAPAAMNFYPDFDNDRIYKMRVNYAYNSWAPWNKPLSADSLMRDVLSLYKHWYPDGNEFLQIDDKDRGTIFVKVDGNRRITIGKFDEMMVKVDFTDLNVEKKRMNK